MSDGGVAIDRQSFGKRMSSNVKCIKLFLVQGTWPLPKQTTPDMQALKFQPRIYGSCLVLQYPMVCAHGVLHLLHVVNEINVWHHTSTSRQNAS